MLTRTNFHLTLWLWLWLIISLLSLDSLTARSLSDQQPNYEISNILPAEREVNVSASQAWELYGGINLYQFLKGNLPNVYKEVEVLHGDGGVGTLLNLVFQPGNPGFSNYKLLFTKTNNEKRVTKSEIIEGGYLELGFSFVGFRIEIIETSQESCITRFSTAYKIKKENAANASLISVDPIIAILEAANTYLLKNRETFGRLSAQKEVNVSATRAWELYRGFNFFKFLIENLSNVYQNFKVLHGDGGVGTVVYVGYAPGAFGFTSDLEKFTVEDNKKRVKEVKLIEGGYLELGFSMYVYRIEIIEKHKIRSSCITRLTVEYLLKKDATFNASSLESTESMNAILETANAVLLKNNHT